MKKLYMILWAGLLVSTFALANENIFGIFQKEFKSAKILYDKHNYKSAYKKFLLLSEKAPDNPEINFYLGRCALELKRYDEAMAAFDRVLIINPNHTRSKLEIARIYFETKQYDLAETQLDLVLQDDIPKDVKENILKFKANIESRKPRSFFSSSITFGINYDSNANNDIGDKEFLIPAFNISVSGNPKKSDTTASLSATIMNLYYFKNSREWSLNTIFTTYGSANREYQKNNSLLFSITTIPTYTKSRYKITLPISFNKVFLDGEGYTHNFSLSLGSSFILNPSSSLDASLSYNRNYNEDDSKQDSKSTSFRISYKKIFDKFPSTMLVSTSYTKVDEIDSTRTDINKDIKSYTIQFSKKFFKKLSTTLSYSKSYSDYRDVDVLFGTKREDTQDNYNLSFTYDVTKSFITKLSVTYLDNESNHPPYNYDKTTVGIRFTKSF